MDLIECGTAACAVRVDNDGIGTATFGGLLLPRNVRPMAVGVLQSAAGRQARGLLTRIDRAVLCCDPASMAAVYPSLTPEMRALPKAYVVSPGQVELCNLLMRGAAAAGLLRAVFLREDDARAWLQRTTCALAANQAWWGGSR